MQQHGICVSSLPSGWSNVFASDAVPRDTCRGPPELGMLKKSGDTRQNTSQETPSNHNNHHKWSHIHSQYEMLAIIVLSS